MEDIDKIKIARENIQQSMFYQLLKAITQYNEVYKKAGAVHGCALCKDSKILFFSEDAGRHNAVDTIAGHMWLNNIKGDHKIFYPRGRLTSEMVIKVAQMGIGILFSRSGITHKGLELAQQIGITLIARAKGRHFLVYNGHEYNNFDKSD